MRRHRDAKLAQYEADSLHKKRRRRQESYRKSDAFLHLDRTERRELVRAMLDIIRTYGKGLYLLGEAIDKDCLSPGIDPVQECFTQIIGRFERFLQSRRSKQWGLVTVDRNPTQSDRLHEMLGEFQRHGTRWTNIDRVIEAPMFVDSSTSAGIQIADACAYALRRYLDQGEADLADTIRTRFFRHRRRLHGLRHFTRKGCACWICEERDHR